MFRGWVPATSWHGLLCKRSGGAGIPSPPVSEPVWARRLDWMPADLWWVTAVLLGRSLRHRDNGYVGTTLGFCLELNSSIDQREQRMVPAETDILARMPLGAALARNDIAGDDRLPAEQLDAESTASRIAPVARRTAC